jgi:putative ABC transport system permease protein
MSGDDSRSGLGVEGLVPTSDEPVRAHWRVVAFDYFTAMDIRLVEGRLPTALEAESRASIAVINRTAAARYWPGQSPIGKRLRILTREWREIVGIVEDVRHWGPSNPVNPEVYLPGLRNPTNLVVRASGDPALLTTAIRGQIRQLAPQLPMPTARLMDEIQGEAVAAPRFNLILFGLFAAVALLLAVVGVYGVTSYTVAQSRGDIGLRMAIGARQRDVVRLFVDEGLRLTILGLAIGAVGAFAGTRIMASLLFGVAPTDPATFVGTAVVIAGVALIACYVPARRAAAVDPLAALRGSG